MNLPVLEKETFTIEIREGIEMRFRQPLVSEYDIIMALSETKSIDKLLTYYASLMEGYEEPLERRIEFMKSLKMEDLNVIIEGINKNIDIEKKTKA